MYVCPPIRLQAIPGRMNEGDRFEAMRSAVDAHAILAFTDRRGRILWVNEKFCEVSGYRPEELVGRTHEVVNSGTHPPEFWRDLWTTIVAGRTWRGEICNRRKDGEHYWVDSTIVPVLTQGVVSGFVAIRTDVTRLKAAKRELEITNGRLGEALDAAEAAACAKSEFLATMSHELRTPMNGVLGMLTLLLETDLDPDQRERAETARNSARNLLGLLNEVLDYSKLEAERVELESAVFSPRQVVADVTELLAGPAGAKAIALEVEVDAGTPEFITADPTRLRQVLFNLVGNAVKFTEAGEVRVRLSAPEPHLLRFDVADTGIGIPAEAQPRLFDRFAQADSSITRRFGGTGLGLAISRRLVQRMGGEISVVSAPDQGSTFTFTIACEPAEAPVAEPADPTEAPDLPSGLRVLLVEDNATNQRVATLMLEAFGCVVDVAGNGAEALAQVRGGLDYDVILMDVQMPVMDGVSATRAIRALPSPTCRTPIIAVTANVMPDDIALYGEAGMDDVVAKPVSLESLYTALAHAVADRASETSPTLQLQAGVA